MPLTIIWLLILLAIVHAAKFSGLSLAVCSVSRLRLEQDDVVGHDVILLWNRNKRIITGADLLGRLPRGIAHRQS
jgi:CBS domain containing-hemolysin-like protein